MEEPFDMAEYGCEHKYRERPDGLAETAAGLSFGQRHEESEDKRGKQHVPLGSQRPVQQGDARGAQQHQRDKQETEGISHWNSLRA